MNANTDGCFLDREALGKAIRSQRHTFGINDYGSPTYPIGITQQGLCDYLNKLFDAEINVKKLSRIETGQQEPSFSLIVQISIVLGGPWWRATLCDFVEAALPGDSEEYPANSELADPLTLDTARKNNLTAVIHALDECTANDEIESGVKRGERVAELHAQITGAVDELAHMMGDANTVLMNRRHAVMRRYSTETEFTSLRLQEEWQNQLGFGHSTSEPTSIRPPYDKDDKSLSTQEEQAAATPAPTQSAAAIDEPAGKENGHEQE